ncbi:MAG: DUF5684 domain-containing protein [Actinomycetota bacterium]
MLAQSTDGWGGLGFTFWLIYAIVLVVYLASLWVVFTKAGRPGWAAIIPIYNIWVLLEIVGRPGWWLILYLIPIVNIVVHIIVLVDLSKSFGHGAGFAIGLLLIPIIFFPVLAWGDSTYRGPSAPGAPGAAPVPPPPPPPAPA